MIKKIISCILIVSTILILLTGCKNINNVIDTGTYQTDIEIPQKENQIIEYNSYVLNWDNYGSWREDINKVIISNTNELQDFCVKLENEDESYALVDRINRSTDLFIKYNEEYFKNQSLAILGVDLVNGNEHIDLKKATKENNNVKIDYEIALSGEFGITVVRKCYIIVEIDKDITGIIDNCLNK